MNNLEKKVAEAVGVDKAEFLGKNSFGAREFITEKGYFIYVTDSDYKKGNSELKNVVDVSPFKSKCGKIFNSK